MISPVLSILILISTSTATWAFQQSPLRHVASNYVRHVFNRKLIDGFQKDGTRRSFKVSLPAAATGGDSTQKRSQPKSKGANKATRKQRSKGAAKKSSKNASKTKVGNTRKKAPKKRNKLMSPGIQSNVEAANSDSMYIQFSRVFQRHVVYQNPTHHSKIDNLSNKPIVLQSFEFLDEAMKQYPNVSKIIAPRDLPFPPPTCSIDDVDIERKDKREKEVDDCETTIAGMGLTTLCELEYPLDNVYQVRGWTSSDNDVDGHTDALGYRYDQSREAIQTLLELVRTPESEVNLPRHFFRLDLRRFALRGMTSDMIKSNYDRLVHLLGDMLEMEPMDLEFVLSNFPQLCLYDSEELKMMVDFLISPLPPPEYVSVFLVADKGVGAANVDWPILASKGYGAGLTRAQAAAAVRMMPELLALYYEDSMKPSIVYMHTNMQLALDPALLDETTVNLNQILEGTPPSDTFFFAFLSSLGITWGQLRILTCALKLWCNCNLDPTWEILQQDQVRSMFKSSSLDYLRQRLQITPSDVHKMIKTHSRLTGYDACFNMKPTLNHLQNSYELTSGDVKKLILRMPSLIGMSKKSIDEKQQFFEKKAGMSKAQIKTALLKQPSLIQYSLDNTLRPKVNFFIHELGMDITLIPRIITTSPTLMGYSLAGSLRPKVCCLMTKCALNQYQVGVMIATAPSILELSLKGKIEPTLRHLSEILDIVSPHDLGTLLMAAPRIILHSIASHAGKFALLENVLGTKNKAIEIVRNNPSLMTWSLNALKERIEQTLDSNTDIFTSLQPSAKGRRRLIPQSPSTAHYNKAVVISTDSTFQSISSIYPTITAAAKETKTAKSDIKNAVESGKCVDATFFSYLTQLPESNKASKDQSEDDDKVTLSIFVSGSVHPGDRIDIPRGSSRTGGVCLKVAEADLHRDFGDVVNDFHAAATACFGVVLNPVAGDAILLVFPLLNASKNRCDLFACWAALRVLETLIKARRKSGDNNEYDIKIFSDSNYALKLASNTHRLLKLGKSFTFSQELLTSLGMNRAYSNVDILHPLARSFSRLNGQEEPPQSRNKAVDRTKVQFLHTMESKTTDTGILVERHAKTAAKWQYSRK